VDVHHAFAAGRTGSAFAAFTIGSLGLILLIIGLRGWRIDDHPWCRKCRYDLSGLDEPAACPECGADLARRRAVRIGLHGRVANIPAR
jgi:hypothetical protein